MVLQNFIPLVLSASREKRGIFLIFPFITKAYGSLRVKKEGNIASGYFVIFITHRVRVCTENLRTSVAYCAFCNNGAQIGLRALYCDVIITPKAHCLQCIENFAKHWMHSAGLTMFLQLFMQRKPYALVGYCILHNLRVRLIKFRVCSRCLLWLIIVILTAFRAIRLTYITLTFGSGDIGRIALKAVNIT